MPFHIRDPETGALVRELAGRKGVGLTEAVRRELEREAKKTSLWERTADIRARIASFPETGQKADKAFYDWLSGEDEEK